LRLWRRRYTCFFLGVMSGGRRGLRTNDLTPGPALASTTWDQFFFDFSGSIRNLFTNRTQALHISPSLVSVKLKQE
jgi:hypothetical protein